MNAAALRTALRRAGAIALFAALSPAALAHYLWLEAGAAGPRLFFGEVNEVREQSPGRLDEIAAPRVWTAAPGTVARDHTVQRRRGSFAIGAAGATDLLATESGFAVQDWTRQGIGVVKPMFYARLAAWPASTPIASDAAMRLDVQPLPGAADGVLVLFDGKALPRAKLVVHAPNGWDQEHTADAQGRIQVLLPWRGLYVLEAIHKEPAPGEFGGRRYEAVRHRATLSIVQATGIDPAGTGALAPEHPDH